VNEYWARKVKKNPEPIQIFGFGKKQITTESERIYVDLGEERTTLLRELAQQEDIRSLTENASLFNIFATVLFGLLSRISDQQQFLVGSPAHNRVNLDFRETPGLFIEFFPLYAEIESQETFSTLFQKLRGETMDFLRHAQPGAATSTLSNSFNVILNYIHTAFPDFAGMPMQSKWINPDNTDASHHFRLQIHDFDATGNLHLCFDLNNTVFNTEQKADIQRYFLTMLDAFIQDRKQEIVGVPNSFSSNLKMHQFYILKKKYYR